MMDTNIWSCYAGKEAKYAIGGPPIEMYCTSYKESHEASNISCDVSGTIGYSYSNAKGLGSDCNKIYTKPQKDKADAQWVVAPFHNGTNLIVYADSVGYLSNNYYYSYSYYPGLCPVVCLKSGIQLEKVSDGVYSIK